MILGTISQRRGRIIPPGARRLVAALVLISFVSMAVVCIPGEAEARMDPC